MVTITDQLNKIYLQIRPHGVRGVEFELVDLRQPRPTRIGFVVDEEFDNPNFVWCIDAIAELQAMMQAALTLTVEKIASLN